MAADEIRDDTSDNEEIVNAADVDDDDLEAQMAAAMGGDDADDDLEAQMAAAMGGVAGDDDLEAQMAAVLNGDESNELMSGLGGPGAGSDDNIGDDDEEIDVQSVKFQQLRQSDETASKDSIDRLMDVGLVMSVELGRKQMQIKEILELGPGKIIELDKLAGEPVDLLVNGKLLARGEVVVVDENFGVRITDLINPKDRVRSLS